MKKKAIMIAAGHSGSGKTIASCALMAALKERGLTVAAAKCGPDYIDPMFHRKVVGVASENLDLFFQEETTLKRRFEKRCEKADITVAEGVMGYYDGMSLSSWKGSTYDVARALDLPVIFVMPCRGMAISAVASMMGYLEFQKDSRIKGILLNRISAGLYPRMKEMLEQELKARGYDISVVGYLPDDPVFSLESRHLGLKTPEELEQKQGRLKEQLKEAGTLLAETIDLEKVQEIAKVVENETAGQHEAAEEGHVKAADRQKSGTGENAENVEAEDHAKCVQEIKSERCMCINGKKETSTPKDRTIEKAKVAENPIIAVARDPAFQFYYPENLEVVEQCGGKLVEFSPLYEETLPEGTKGLILGGGYPELYAEALSANTAMRLTIQKAIREGMPCLAECGGFLYLQEELEDVNGKIYPMAGVIRGVGYPRKKLTRFGYLTLTVEEDTLYLKKGEQIKGHEFHYWETTDNGTAAIATKPDQSRKWACIHAENRLFAGFPHLAYGSCPQMIRRFIEEARKWKEKQIIET